MPLARPAGPPPSRCQRFIPSASSHLARPIRLPSVTEVRNTIHSQISCYRFLLYIFEVFLRLGGGALFQQPELYSSTWRSGSMVRTPSQEQLSILFDRQLQYLGFSWDMLTSPGGTNVNMFAVVLFCHVLQPSLQLPIQKKKTIGKTASAKGLLPL